MPVPNISYVTAGTRFLASHYNSVKDYLDYLLNPPGASAYRTVAGSLPTATWSNSIGMDGEDYDRDGIHDTSTNNARMTFTTAGRYRVTARLTFEPNATGFRALEVRLNSGGSQTGGTFMTEATATGTTASKNTTLEQNWSRYFNAGDYIEMFAYQNSGATLNYVTGIRRTGIEVLMIGTN